MWLVMLIDKVFEFLRFTIRAKVWKDAAYAQSKLANLVLLLNLIDG